MREQIANHSYATDVQVGLADQGPGSGALYARMVRAQDDRRRVEFHNKVRQKALAEGHSAVEAHLMANHAASPWAWVASPFINGKRNPNVQNALLSEDDWRVLTDEVIAVQRQRLLAVDHLRSRGLVYPVQNLGVMRIDWQKMSDLQPAEVTMGLRANESRDQGDLERDSVPLPIIHKTFFFDFRDLLASRNGGRVPLDVTHAAIASRLIAEKMENILVQGDANFVFEGATLYGYQSHTGRINVTGADFGTTTNIELTFRNLIETASTNNHYGPFGVYLHPTQFSQMKQIYQAGDSTITMDIIRRQHPEIEFIEESKDITAGTGIAVELDRMTVDLAIGAEPTMIQWEDPGGAGVYMRLFASVAPRIKVDREGQTGLYEMTGI